MKQVLLVIILVVAYIRYCSAAGGSEGASGGSSSTDYVSYIVTIQVLWTSLVELNKSFSKPPGQISSADIEAFEAQAKQWVSNFIDVYQTKNVTPYIHAMFNHVGEFMRVHGSILAFTQQGLEKMNDVMTKHYFRATVLSTKRGNWSLFQFSAIFSAIEHAINT